MGICQQCVFFRSTASVDQLWGTAAGVSDASVASALTQISQESARIKDVEAERENEYVKRNQNQWELKPQMSEFCGIREAQGEYIVTRVKNLGLQCTEFKQGAPDVHSCSDCAFRIIELGDQRVSEAMADGNYNDSVQAALKTIATIFAVPGNPLIDAINKQAQNQYQQSLAVAGSRKAKELLTAFHMNGYLSDRPMYLDFCLRQTTEGKYIVCAMQNPYSNCGLWVRQTKDFLDAKMLFEQQKLSEAKSTFEKVLRTESPEEPLYQFSEQLLNTINGMLIKQAFTDYEHSLIESSKIKHLKEIIQLASSDSEDYKKAFGLLDGIFAERYKKAEAAYLECKFEIAVSTLESLLRDLLPESEYYAKTNERLAELRPIINQVKSPLPPLSSPAESQNRATYGTIKIELAMDWALFAAKTYVYLDGKESISPSTFSSFISDRPTVVDIGAPPGWHSVYIKWSMLKSDVLYINVSEGKSVQLSCKVQDGLLLKKIVLAKEE